FTLFSSVTSADQSLLACFVRRLPLVSLVLFFFLTHPPSPQLSTLSLHDALPISASNTDTLTVTSSTAVLAVALAASTTSSTPGTDRKSTRLNSSHGSISYAVFCLKKKKEKSMPSSSRNTKQPKSIVHSTKQIHRH